MTADGEACSDRLFAQVSQQLVLLQDAIVRHDLIGIEEHTDSVRQKLKDLQPLLSGERTSLSGLQILHQTAHNCLALITHMQATARALSALYRYVSAEGAKD